MKKPTSKTVKRGFTACLCILIVLSGIPLNGFVGIELSGFDRLKKFADSVSGFFDGFSIKADAAESLSGSCGNDLWWSLDIYSGELVVSGTGDMDSYEYTNTSPWDSNRDIIREVIIGDGVTSIGRYAFNDCPMLMSVLIGNGVTTIENGAFLDCEKLNVVTIPDGITNIYMNAFKNTGIYNNPSNWENDVLYIGNHLIEAKKTISGICSIKEGTKTVANLAFENCTSLEEITIPNSVTYIGNYVFSSCTGVKSIIIPESVVSIGDGAFYSCNGLTSVAVPDSVISIGEGVFYNCAQLADIQLPDNDIKIGELAVFGTAYFNNKENWENGALYVGKHLLNVDDTLEKAYSIKEGTITIGNSVFESSRSLEEIIIPDSVVSIGDKSFYCCNALTEITIGRGVKSIGFDAFKKPSQSYNLNLVFKGTIADWCNIKMANENSNPMVFSFTENFYINNELLTKLVIPEEVTTVEDFVFANCDTLKTVEIPDHVTHIGEGAFKGYHNVETLTLGKGLKSIGKDAFDKSPGVPIDITYNGDIDNWCEINFTSAYSNPAYWHTSDFSSNFYSDKESVYNITIPQNVTNINDYAFYGFRNLSNIEIPDSVTSIGVSAFEGCESLISITVPYGVTNIGDSAFRRCKSLQQAIILGPVTRINNSTYEDCVSLDTISLPESITAIGEKAFYSCGSLEKINIPNNVTKLGDYVFWCCDSLSEIILPSGITEIPVSAFEFCTSLTYVEFTNNVTKIGEWAFSGCTKLKDVCFIGLEEEWNNINIADCNSNLTAIQPQFRYVYKIKVWSVDDPSMVIAPGEKKLVCFSLFKYEELLNDCGDYHITATNTLGSQEIEYTTVFFSEDKNVPQNLIVLDNLPVGRTKITIENELFDVKEDFTVTVAEYADQQLSCNVDNVPINTEEQLLAKDISVNFHTNGLYMTDYSYSENKVKMGYDVSFNVYNTLTLIGSVDIYNKNGELINCFKIDKHETLPDIITAGEYIFYDIINPDEIFSFTSKKDSIKTSFSFFVPNGGYFTIGNNASFSVSTFLYNYLDIIFTLSSFASNQDSNNDTDLVDLMAEAFLADKLIMDSISEMMTGVFKESLLYFLEPDTWLNLTNKAEEFFKKIEDNININSTTKNVINNFLQSIPVIKHASEFFFGTLEKLDLFCQALNLGNSYANNIVSVFAADGAERTSSFGVCANYNPRAFNNTENVVLHVFRVVNDELTQKAELDCSDYVSYNICFLQGGAECQPNEKVEVRIPLPEGYNPNDIKLLHETNENESGFEELDFQVIDGYIVFESDHFSLFTVVLANSDYDSNTTSLYFKTKKIDTNVGNLIKLELITEPNELPSNRIVWKSSNEDVASLIENGVVLAKSPGTAVISAETIDGSSIDYCEITVLGKKYKVTWIVDGTTAEYNVTEGSKLNSPEIPEKTGYTFAGWTPAVPETMPAEDLTFTATWFANNYDAVFDANGGAWSDGITEKSVSTAFGSQITAPQSPLRQGYIFSKWSPDVGVMDSVNGKTFIAEWVSESDVQYAIETYTMNTFGEYEKSTHTLNGTAGEMITAEYEISDGFTLNTEKSILEGTILADSLLVLKVYIDRNIYVFTSVVDGVSTETEYYYGSTVSEPLVPAKAGYKFAGWDNPIPSTMPAKDLTVTAEFKILFEMSIRNPSTTSVSYGDKLILHADMNDALPNGWKVEWTADNSNFDYSTSADGSTCTISPSSKGDTIFTATVYDENENEICSDTQSITSKAGFFDKIIAFFKKLFGLTKTIPQFYKGVF